MSDTIGMEEKVLKLKKYITTEGRTISELTLREPTASELEKAEISGKGSDTARTIMLVSLVSGVHVNIIKNLAASDLGRASLVVAGFLEIGPEDGESLSPI